MTSTRCLHRLDKELKKSKFSCTDFQKKWMVKLRKISLDYHEKYQSYKIYDTEHKEYKNILCKKFIINFFISAKCLLEKVI